MAVVRIVKIRMETIIIIMVMNIVMVFNNSTSTPTKANNVLVPILLKFTRC